MFGDYGEVRLLSSQEFTREVVRDADALVIRSETRITRELLEGSAVRFVGSMTIGTDHVDLDYLSARGVGFASAPGSNARSVGEYVAASLLRYAERHGVSLAGATLGVVGVGHTGTEVARRAEALGMRILRNDPPLAARGAQRLVPLDDLMQADFVSLHVPLTKSGPDATLHLFDADRLARMRPGAVLINTSRGAVVDAAALKRALRSEHLGAALLDVWENEPAIDGELLEMVELGTPHIAGYSFDGKVAAARAVHEAMGSFLGLPPRWTVPADLPPPAVGELRALGSAGTPSQARVAEVVHACYDIDIDDAALRETFLHPAAERPTLFRRLRSTYRIRREFSATRVRVEPPDAQLERTLTALGFQVSGRSES